MGRSAGTEDSLTTPVDFEEVLSALPLLHRTPRSWAELAAANLPEFLADHAVCEQQVAMYALSLAGYYPTTPSSSSAPRRSRPRRCSTSGGWWRS